MTRIKICGNTSINDVREAIKFGADALGFITEVPVESKRKLSLTKTSELIKEVPIFVDSVLVIMPKSIRQAIEMIETAKPNIVQIHNELEFKDMQFLRESIDIPIIQKFSIPTLSNNKANNKAYELIKLIKMYENSNLIDGVLLDSSVQEMVGGTGITHDWRISKKIQNSIKTPVILAGGLNPENVQEAIKSVTPFAVDVASGIETDGKRDNKKMFEFINAVRLLNAKI